MSHDVLSKSIWSNEDIMQYFGCRVNKAINIKKLAISKYKGFVPMFPFAVYRDAVLKAVGVDLNHELEIQEALKRIEKETE